MSSIERLDHERVVVYRDWVEEALFSEVQSTLKGQAPRKRVYQSSHPTTPESFLQLNRFIGLRLAIGANVFIGKRYDNNHKYVSRAYDIHQDPLHWRTQDLLTLTTSGEATMQFIDSSSNQQEFPLGPNTLVRMQPDVLHAVTPPQTDIPREVLFLGRSALR